MLSGSESFTMTTDGGDITMKCYRRVGFGPDCSGVIEVEKINDEE
jgi:hypothetical protein